VRRVSGCIFCAILAGQAKGSFIEQIKQAL
jgi:hypothetical protein